jgi:hypothetical protein
MACEPHTQLFWTLRVAHEKISVIPFLYEWIKYKNLTHGKHVPKKLLPQLIAAPRFLEIIAFISNLQYVYPSLLQSIKYSNLRLMNYTITNSVKCAC